MKKRFLVLFIFVFIVIIALVIYRFGFYYIILNEENSYKYTRLSISRYIDIYNASMYDFENKAANAKNSNFIKNKYTYNNKKEDRIIKYPMEAIKIAKDYLYYVDGKITFKEPCFVTYNSNANAWIVQENIYKYPSKDWVGGEFVAVINAENGDIVYAVHFQ